MPLPLSPADRQRRITQMRSAQLFGVPLGASVGYRTAVHELVYLPEQRLAWIVAGSGTRRLPVPLFEWARLVTEELAGMWDLEESELFPFQARFWRQGDEYFVDMDRPE